MNPINRLILYIASYFGARAKEVERFLKFAIVGIIGAVVDFGVLNLLQSTVLPPVDPNHNAKIALASGISFYCAVTSNFIWNRYWTYPDSRSRSIRRQLAQFAVVNTAGVVFRIIFVSVSFHFLGVVFRDVMQSADIIQSLSETEINRIGSNIAQGISIGVVMFWNFFVNRYWTYGDVGLAEASASLTVDGL